MNTSNFFKSKKFKHGSLASVLIAVVVALTIIFNVVMSLLDKKVKFNIRVTLKK